MEHDGKRARERLEFCDHVRGIRCETEVIVVATSMREWGYCGK